jgi:hypothetical protein
MINSYRKMIEELKKDALYNKIDIGFYLETMIERLQHLEDRLSSLALTHHERISVLEEKLNDRP